MSSGVWRGLNLACAFNCAVNFLVSLYVVNGLPFVLVSLAYILLSYLCDVACARARRREWDQRVGRNLPADPEARRDQFARAPKTRRWF